MLGAYHRGENLSGLTPGLLAKMALDWKGLPDSNTLAYSAHSQDAKNVI